ncbi:MarR family winged helix-turn-helix transcriptional regulator [Pedobacter alluvionis]|uniref:MarR family transcriptional regulator n=1 Tax=Pedobacter alluvionis TaxID=475253 RepID=A0A497YCA6_9SPHI|nr:MarR family transcriptional regulator [Pedobacter alluvionis]RLJ80116.1 MarR family transcriptional regulator [Pedobacter alluvionis]TFB31407.1 MarR family transcriptional regulator [Pedobacter alluvionis]
MPDKSFSVKSADDSSGFLLWQVTALWQRGIKKVLEVHNLTHSQFVLLASLLWLSGEKENVTQIDLSAHSKIDPMTTSTVLRTLQSKGFLARKEHSTDTRAKIVQLTDNGISVTRLALKTVEKFDVDFFSVLKSKRLDFNALVIDLIAENK